MEDLELTEEQTQFCAVMDQMADLMDMGLGETNAADLLMLSGYSYGHVQHSLDHMRAIADVSQEELELALEALKSLPDRL